MIEGTNLPAFVNPATGGKSCHRETKTSKRAALIDMMDRLVKAAMCCRMKVFFVMSLGIFANLVRQHY